MHSQTLNTILIVRALSLGVSSGDELNRWQGDLGLTAVGQEDTGGGRPILLY